MTTVRQWPDIFGVLWSGGAMLDDGLDTGAALREISDGWRRGELHPFKGLAARLFDGLDDRRRQLEVSHSFPKEADPEPHPHREEPVMKAWIHCSTAACAVALWISVEAFLSGSADELVKRGPRLEAVFHPEWDDPWGWVYRGPRALPASALVALAAARATAAIARDGRLGMQACAEHRNSFPGSGQVPAPDPMLTYAGGFAKSLGSLAFTFHCLIMQKFANLGMVDDPEERLLGAAAKAMVDETTLFGGAHGPLSERAIQLAIQGASPARLAFLADRMLVLARQQHDPHYQGTLRAVSARIRSGQT